MARVTGQRFSSTLAAADTPRETERFSPYRAGYPDALNPAQSAAAAWRTVTAVLAGTPHVRLSFDGGRTYPARHARPLSAEPPADQPCTVAVYDPGRGTGKLLALDLDPSHGDVGGQAGELGQLLERLGARYVADVATSTGGRHIYVSFSSSLPWLELRDVARAIALRFPAVDPAPMCSIGGQISPPGSRAKRGGWRVLSMPVDVALEAVRDPNGPEVWGVLLTEFAGELQQLEQPHGDAQQVDAEPDDSGILWVPRPGGRAPLGAELEQAARTGRWDRAHYPGRSEVRMAILGAAAARGWRLADVRAAVGSGAWKGFPELYYRASAHREQRNAHWR